MADNALFERVCQEIECGTELTRLSARGAVRLALRDAGLEVATLNVKQASAVLRLVLPAELRKCGVADPESLCAALAREITASSEDAFGAVAAPEDMFRRIRGR